jgi:hypothetical protein
MSSRLVAALFVGLFPFAPQSLNAQLLSQWEIAPSVEIANTSPQNYAGDDACRPCHSKKVESYFHSAHHLTSRLPANDSILGSFANGKNILKTANPTLYFQMDSRPDGFYQTSVSVSPSLPTHSQRMDIVVGSGRVGQTYLYWKDHRLFQLPVSYWVDLDSWVNSPGYRDGTANFDRPVVPRCLECHMTYAESVPGSAPPNIYKPASLLLGISCERCHGPARDHLELMTAKKTAAAIVNPSKLSREQQIDLCAQCHGGRRFPLAAPFSYLPGEPLDEFYQRDQSAPSATPDVHGNQVALLQMSRCYLSSPQMTCSTCHDVHQPQHGAAAFSTHCLKCHNMETCGEFPKLGNKIAVACVNCHMPVQPSNLIISNSNGKQTRAMVRNHWIKIYSAPLTP